MDEFLNTHATEGLWLLTLFEKDLLSYVGGTNEPPTSGSLNAPERAAVHEKKKRWPVRHCKGKKKSAYLISFSVQIYTTFN